MLSVPYLGMMEGRILAQLTGSGKYSPAPGHLQVEEANAVGVDLETYEGSSGRRGWSHFQRACTPLGAQCDVDLKIEPNPLLGGACAVRRAGGGGTLRRYTHPACRS